MDQTVINEAESDTATLAPETETPVSADPVSEQSAETAATADAVATAPLDLHPQTVEAKRLKKRKRAAISDKKKKLLHDWLVVPVLILCAGLIRGVVVRVFMTSPVLAFAPGGVTGIGTMIEYVTDGKFSTGYTNLIINTPLIIIAFIFLSKSYAVKTAISVGLSSGLMILFQKFSFPQYGVGDANAEPVLGAVACGVLGGIGVAMMLRAGGSNGGTDIIAALIQRKFAATGITWFIMGLDALVVLSSYFVYKNGWTPIFMSFTQQFASAMVGDVILTGLKSAIKYEIITDDPEGLSAEIIERLHHSVTKLNATGMYSHSERAMLVCVIHKRQVGEFNAILKKYPNTFAYVQSTNEVYGKFS